jgi:nitrous oxidase accessory protein
MHPRAYPFQQGWHTVVFMVWVGALAGWIPRVEARTWPVGKAHPMATIREAITRAQPNDTILVHAGLYQEGNLIIEKPLHLIGVGQVVLDGENKYEILTIHAQGGSVQRLHFQNTGIASINDLAAIKLLDASRIRVLDNIFENCFFGIYLSNSSRIWIERNSLHSDAEAEHQIGNGIHLWKCEYVSIQHNRIIGHRDGIYFEFVTNSLVTNNHSEGNMRYGLHFMFSNNDEYRYNIFLNNGAGVAVMYTKGVKMYHNRFDRNWGSSAYGLLLKDIRDSEIIANDFSQNSVGIFMEGSSRNLFHDNQFTSNGYAIRLQASCDENDFARNNFRQNTFDMVTNGSLVLNVIKGNYWDRYDGYDLDRDQIGDVPYRPVSLYGTLVERMPVAVLLWRSFLVFLLDRAERAMPALTPENLKDDQPAMKPYAIRTASR